MVAITDDEGKLLGPGQRGEIVVRGPLVMAGYYKNPDCAVIGLPDEKWGERVTAVIQLRPGPAVTQDEVRAFVKERLGSVEAPKQLEVWADLPRSKVGKVLKPEIKSRLRPE